MPSSSAAAPDVQRTLGRGDPPARRAPPAGAGRGDHRRDFRHRGPAARRPALPVGPERLEHPVRDHQLFEHHSQYRLRSPAPSPRASLAARRRRSTTGTGSTTTTTTGAGSDLIEAAAAQFAGINGGVAGLALPQRQRDLRRDHQRGALRQPVEHPVDAVDHDARQSGGARSWSARRSRSPPARRCRPISTTPSAPSSARMSASPSRSGRRSTPAARSSWTCGSRGQLDRRAGLGQLPGPDPQQARDREHDHRRRGRDRRHRRPARRQ